MQGPFKLIKSGVNHLAAVCNVTLYRHRVQSVIEISLGISLLQCLCVAPTQNSCAGQKKQAKRITKM